MATTFPTTVDSQTRLDELINRSHDPAQMRLLLQDITAGMIAAQTKAGAGTSTAVNTISEATSGSGVTVDSTLLKDGGVQMVATAALKWGPGTVLGNWQILVATDTLIVQRLEGEPLAWVTKLTIPAA
jgi:hypothetical protein